jgi:glycosyltransferase involved in cell wall biosynthesis
VPTKILTLSIVIPVYNEEHHLRKCLDAIASQTEKPDEVIIVDNNSTDQSAQIAASYPFVRVLQEPKQGRAYARTAGFNAATCDIIGRIDADSQITHGWVERVKNDFSIADIVGVTGLGSTNVLPWLESVYGTLWSRMYFWAVHSLFRYNTMWGANMAVRRTAWQQVRADVCLDDQVVHEDQDVSMLLLSTGGRILQDNKLLIITKGQSYFYWPKFWEYAQRSFNTKKYHDNRGTVKLQTTKLSVLSVAPGAIIGWAATAIFGTVSFLGWPITELIHHYGKQTR